MRRALVGLIAGLVVVLCGLPVPAAVAAGKPTATAASSPTAASSSTSPPLNGVSPLAPTPTPTTTTPTVAAQTTTAGPGSNSLSTASALAIAIGAMVLIGGISFFIWRDARRRAPVRAGDPLAAGEGRRSGSKPPPKPRKLSPAERKRRKRGRARR